MAKKKEDKIYAILSSIDTALQKQNSTKRIFMQGVVRGLGTALGATVLLAIATSVAIKAAETVNWDEATNYFLTEVVQE